MGSAAMPGQGNFIGEGVGGVVDIVPNPGMPGFGGPRPIRPGGMVRPGFPSGPVPGPGWTSGIKPPPDGSWNNIGKFPQPGDYVQNPGMPTIPNGPGNAIGGVRPNPVMGGAIGGAGPNPGMGDPFSGVSRGRLAEAQRLAALGKMGRAKQQIELGGGAWNPAMQRALRTGGLLG